MRTPSCWSVLVLIALLATPAVALSKEHDGRRHAGKPSRESVRSGGGGHRERSSWSRSEGRSRGSKDRAWSRGGEGLRDHRSPRSSRREREWAPSRGDSRERGGPRIGGERAFRTPSAGQLDRGGRDRAWRTTRGEDDRRYIRREPQGQRRYDSGSRTRERDPYTTRFKPSGPVIQHDQGYAYHAPRYYYTDYFYRPRYIVRSGFFIGLSIGSFPPYGYRYFDPYCDLRFGSLGDYYGHCHGIGHPTAILLIDYRTGAPIATCIYDGGDWVVDDCAHGHGDHADEGGYPEGEYHDEGY